MAREPLGRTLAMLPLLVAMTATAADRQDLRTNAHAISTLHKQTDQGGSPNYHAAFGLGQQEGLTAVSATTDANNVTHTRYRQTLRGVPVWGEQIIISREASGALRGARGGLIEGLSAHQVPARPTVAGAVTETRRNSSRAWILVRCTSMAGTRTAWSASRTAML